MKVFLIAGEASGDKLGAALMEGLKSLVPDVQFHGVGGDQMGAQGLISQFPMHELSIMGIAEVAPKYFHLKRRIREVAEAALALKPDVMITIDSPDFCLRVAKIVKAASASPASTRRWSAANRSKSKPTIWPATKSPKNSLAWMLGSSCTRPTT